MRWAAWGPGKRTFSNHCMAFSGKLYFFAWARTSWANEGKTASKAARSVVAAILREKPETGEGRRDGGDEDSRTAGQQRKDRGSEERRRRRGEQSQRSNDCSPLFALFALFVCPPDRVILCILPRRILPLFSLSSFSTSTFHPCLDSCFRHGSSILRRQYPGTQVSPGGRRCQMLRAVFVSIREMVRPRLIACLLFPGMPQ